MKSGLLLAKTRESRRGSTYICRGVILHYFALQHIPTSGIDLISVVTPRMLKRNAMLLYKTLRAVKRTFIGASKEVVVELSPMADEHQFLVGLKDEKIPKKTPEKQGKRRFFVAVPMILSKSFTEYDDTFYVDYSTS